MVSRHFGWVRYRTRPSESQAKIRREGWVLDQLSRHGSLPVRLSASRGHSIRDGIVRRRSPPDGANNGNWAAQLEKPVGATQPNPLDGSSSKSTQTAERLID